MALDAGEVEARLKARDEMSATIVAVTERIKALQAQIEALGGVTGPTLKMLEQNLIGARMQLLETQLAMKNLGDETGNFAVKAQVASGQMEQVERLATRMVERLIIFYALKGTFDFVVGLFEADNAMVKLHESTNLSLGKLQELSIIADQTGVPFKSLAAAIDQFDKRLAELKPPTSDMLKEIGQDPAKLFTESSDDRITSVIGAIAQLPSQLQRTKAEFVLFGNDAIDPLVQKFLQLKQAADEAVRPDAQVEAMSQTVQMYKMFAAELGTIAAGIIAKGQEAVNSLFAPATMEAGDPSAKKFKDRQMTALLMSMLGGAGGGPLGILDALAGKFDNPGKMGGPDGFVQIPPAGNKSQSDGNVPLMNDAYIASLKAQSLELDKLSDKQLIQMDELRSMNEFTLQGAVNIGFSTTQYREMSKALQQADADWKKVTADFERFDGENYKLSEAQQAQITIMKLQGKTAREIADETDLPIQAIVKWERQWTMSLQIMDREGKEFLRQLQGNVDAIARAINDTADASGAPGGLQPTKTGNAAFDAAANKRNAAIDAAQRRMGTDDIGPIGPLADAQKAEEQTAALAQMAKAEQTFTEETAAAARAAQDLANSNKAAAAAVSEAFNPGSTHPGGTFIAQPGSTVGNGLQSPWWAQPQQIPHYAEGGPTKDGLAVTHDGEYVIPKGGALVMGRPGGGGDTYNITVPLQGLAVTTDPGGLAIIETTVTKAISSVMRQGRRFGSA